MSGPFKVAAVQAAPVFLDMAATTKKAVALIDEAGKAGAKLVAFPETWLPGYPWWIWLAAPAHGMAFVGRYHANSPMAGGPEDKAIADAARRNRIHVVLGLSEKVGGSLYMAQWIYGPDGVVIARRKKLKPTHVERTVFGEGDGSDLEVFDTAIGRIGALCCWEHLQPLTKYAMYSMNEQIHIASWPSFSLYRGMAYALGPELNTAASQMYAAEGQCFVVASCATVSDEMVEMLCDAPDKQMFLKAGGGFSRVFGPDGAPIGDGLPETKEGLVIAEIDLGMISIAKSAADPAGHYSRPDVTRLLLNRRPSPRVMSFEDQPREVSGDQAGMPAGVEDSRRRAVG
ncbi:MAG TPA: carbon-nitrogen hydrolase family protein [Xanthobacteraceae bacterium]|nr:carbon-nitrogen hydrolase family protein [Xanthobacteraceae bacterium]